MNVLVLFFALAKFSGILFRLIYFNSINYELKKHAGWVEKILPKTIWIFTRETAVTICMQFCHFFLFDFSYSVSTPHNTNVAGPLIKLSIFLFKFTSYGGLAHFLETSVYCGSIKIKTSIIFGFRIIQFRQTIHKNWMNKQSHLK